MEWKDCNEDNGEDAYPPGEPLEPEAGLSNDLYDEFFSILGGDEILDG